MTPDPQRVDRGGPIPRRSRDSHKGTFGTVLVVGGSEGMIGAPTLAGLSALRGGAGLVQLAVPRPIQQTVASLCPCATSIALDVEDNGITPRGIAQVLEAAGSADVLVVGPGLGQSPAGQQLLRGIIAQDIPAVIDADGLNHLARIHQWPMLRRCPLILTPHPGEFARLTDAPIGEIQADREGRAVEAVQQWQANDGSPELLLVLKGAGTVVADGEQLYVNDTGNPGMATGGTGDVLAGLSAAMTLQGLPRFEAVCNAVYVHGLAGDHAARQLTEQALMASDLLEFLPEALAEVQE